MTKDSLNRAQEQQANPPITTSTEASQSQLPHESVPLRINGVELPAAPSYQLFQW